MTVSRGKVDILGAGPGSPEFLTLAGQRIVAQAEVLIYDALIDSRLLTLAQRNCELIQMGKRGGQQSVSQSEINQQLITACQQGKRVVRLKSGDPFVFGRTMDEIQALEAANCQVQVWPGLSSVFAAPLLAGISLTDKVLSQSVAVFSGHDLDSLNWLAITQLDTAVILMGTRNLAQICAKLISSGRSPDTPVAVIQACSWPQQKDWYGTLATIPDLLPGQSLSPAVVVVGEVVNQRHSFPSDFTQPLQPLLGKTIVVTRAASQVSQFRDRLQDLGAHVLEMPALDIVPPSCWDDLDQAIATIQSFDWLILTSGNAVDYFFRRLQHQRKDSRSLAELKIAVVGRKTAAQLSQYGITPDYIPPNFVADSLVQHFPDTDLHSKQILFPRVESGGRDVLVREFQAQGAQVHEVAAYQSACPSDIPAAVLSAFQQQTVDAVTFASSKTVQHFHLLLQRSLDDINPGQSEAVHSVQELLDAVCIASIGPLTSKSCAELLGGISLEAEEYTLDGLAQGLITYFTETKI